MEASLSPVACLRSGWPMIGLSSVVSSTFLGSVLLLHCWNEIPFGDLMRHPTAVARMEFYTGFLSQIGIFFWAAAAAICLCSAWVLRDGRDRHSLRWFLVASGLLTLVLGIDDVFPFS
jgi:hypothetical protein